MANELQWLSLTELSGRIRDREVSAVEATSATLDRIQALDPTFHAYVTVMAERALARARAADAEIGAGRYRGPLHGVPVGVKDLCNTRGVRTTAGTSVLRDNVPSEDATVVERLENAGAIIVGKLALTEGAYATHHPSVTPPVNPWNSGRWTGVSSSGSGVATAVGLCYASLGSDTGGSIRFPSAACGVVGLKPTWGRVSRYGVFPLAASLDHIGPMARTVADAAAVLGIIAGYDPRDATSLRAPVPDYLAATRRGAKGLRIGIDRAFVSEGMDGEITQAVLRCADVLSGQGAEIRTTAMPSPADAIQAWPTVCAVEAAVAHEALYPERAAEYGPLLGPFLANGRAATALDYAKAHEVRMKFNGALAGVFQAVDVILCPSLGVTTPPAEGTPGNAGALGLVMRFTAPFDFSGSPTISVPCGFTGDGMPISLQLVGRHLDEESLIAAGHAYQQATDWHARRPPLAV